MGCLLGTQTTENLPTNMTPTPLYRAGIELFNRGEFFEAHEVWEDLWHACASADRRFYQALIQAAVAAYHWGRGNAAGEIGRAHV